MVLMEGAVNRGWGPISVPAFGGTVVVTVYHHFLLTGVPLLLLLLLLFSYGAYSRTGCSGSSVEVGASLLTPLSFNHP
jgi:hypothetical protein